MLLAFSKSNDSPCFVKIAIFSQKFDRCPVRVPVIFLIFRGIRKAALGELPVAGRNRRGFSAEKEAFFPCHIGTQAMIQ